MTCRRLLRLSRASGRMPSSSAAGRPARSSAIILALICYSLVRPAWSEAAPIRIHFDYTHLREGTFENALRNEIMPRAATEVAKRVFVKEPVQGPMHIPAPNCLTFNSPANGCTEFEKCKNLDHQPEYFGAYRLCSGGSCLNVPAGEGVPDADVLVYVSVNYDTQNGNCPSGSTMAVAGACEDDDDGFNGRPPTERPVAGRVEWNFECWKDVTEQDWNSSEALETAVHELLHILYFSDGLAEDYIDDLGQTLPNNMVFGKDSQGRDAYISPAVLAAAKEQYGCNTLTGVPTDEDTPFDHWSEAFMPGDVMIPGGTQRWFSSMTMALADDSGWYVSNDEQKSFLPLVFNAGCDLLGEDCDSFSNTDVGKEIFCNKDEKDKHETCSSDRHTIRRCDGDKGELCRLREISDNVEFGPGDDDEFLGNCLSTKNQQISQGWYGNTFGQTSRCIETKGRIEWDAPKGNPSSADSFSDEPRCVKMQCTAGLLQLVFGDVVLPCATGDFVDVSGISPEGDNGGKFGDAVLGPCPDNKAMCAELRGDSSLCGETQCVAGQGMCVDGKCQCQIGWSGPSCSEQTCKAGVLCDDGSTCNLRMGTCDGGGEPTDPDPDPEDPGEHAACCEDAGEDFEFFGMDSVCVAGQINSEKCKLTRKLTFKQAAERCEAVGARLCTIEELELKVAKRSACKVFKRNVWTSTPCARNGRQGFLSAKGGNGKRSKCMAKRAKRSMLCCMDAC